MGQVKVSVVIPVYNIEAHLRQCLDSVAGQSLSDLEIICVDDGSTDTSPAILAEYARRDPRFQVVWQANAGPGAARNRGMELAAGKYLIFLDSDDWFEPDFLERMTARGQTVPAGLCFKGEVQVSRSGRVPGSGVRLPQRILRRAHRHFEPGAHPPPGEPARVGVQLPVKDTGGLVPGAEASGVMHG